MRCRTCALPRARWNTADPLYRTWSGTCPTCHRADIDHDTNARRREDV